MSKKDEAAAGAVDLDALVLKVQRQTCTGDIRDFLLHRLQHDKNPLPWSARPEAEQQATIDACQAHAEAMVEAVVRIVAAAGRRTLSATLERFTTAKDEIKATVKMPSADETLVALNRARGASMEIVIADARPYGGERKPAVPDADQPLLPEG